MKKLKVVWAVAIVVSVFVILLSAIVQIKGQNKIAYACSYLDPIIVDILALSAALFLIVEGFVKISKNSKQSLRQQLTRIIRISFGFAILTLHTIQILHK